MLWGAYFILYGPAILFSLAGLFAFAYAKYRGAAVSWSYFLAPMIVLVGVYIMTWFVLRLRWYLVFGLAECEQSVEIMPDGVPRLNVELLNEVLS